MPSAQDDEHWMREALEEARKCLDNPKSKIQNPKSPDVPVGALCVLDNQIIGRGHNRREADNDPTAHAELFALRQAAQFLNSWRLENVTLYVTLEPCPMCAGAIWLARIPRIVFGAFDSKAGACGSLFDIPRDPRLNHRPQVRGGVLESGCSDLLKEFFAARRNEKLTTDEHR